MGARRITSPVVKGSDLFGPWPVAVDPRPPRTVKSAERTLALFELFSFHQRPLTVGEIASHLSIPQPSVSMLVSNLATLGYLEHDRRARTYVPTIRIMLLGSWIHRQFSKGSQFERRLAALRNRLGESVVVGIQNGIYCQYVLAHLAEVPDCLEVTSGMMRPITRTAIGRVLLSLKPDHEIDAIARRCNAEMGDNLAVQRTELMQMISGVRAQGYARTWGDMTSGQSVIAVAVPGPTGRMAMGIGVGGPIDRITEKEREIMAALREFKFEAQEPRGETRGAPTWVREPVVAPH